MAGYDELIAQMDKKLGGATEDQELDAFEAEAGKLQSVQQRAAVRQYQRTVENIKNNPRIMAKLKKHGKSAEEYALLVMDQGKAAAAYDRGESLFMAEAWGKLPPEPDPATVARRQTFDNLNKKMAEGKLDPHRRLLEQVKALDG
jgi:hypothetical protein